MAGVAQLMAGAEAILAAPAPAHSGASPIVLYCDLATDPAREQEMLDHYHNDFKPAAEKFEAISQTVFLDRWEGKRFNSPNDLVFAPDGSRWFTDPPCGLDLQAKDPAKEMPFSGVYRSANCKWTAVIRDLDLPNDTGFSPDGRTLYISNSGPKMSITSIRRRCGRLPGQAGAPDCIPGHSDQ